MKHIETISSVSILSDRINELENELEQLKKKRFDLLVELKNGGVPYRVLGHLIGVSRQRAKQLLDAYELNMYRPKPDES